VYFANRDIDLKYLTSLSSTLDVTHQALVPDGEEARWATKLVWTQ
jgi:hypothetical protein